MKYFKQTISYLKKNLWLPIAAMVVPAIVACFLSTPYWEVSFVSDFKNPDVPISETFRVLFGDSWQQIWPVVVISIFQIFGATLTMSAVDKHFRTGKLSLRMPLRLANNTIFPITLGIVIMCVISIIWRFALFGLVSLVQVIAHSLGFAPQATIVIISAIAVVLFFFHVLVITPILFWAPIMFIYGYRFRDAAATSFKMLAGKKVFRGMILPLLLCAAIQIAVGFANAHYAVSCVVDFIIFLATNVFVTVYVIITFYEISGLDRRDVKPYENIPIPPLPEKQSKSVATDGNGSGPETEKPKKKKAEKKSSENTADDKPDADKSSVNAEEGGDVV